MSEDASTAYSIAASTVTSGRISDYDAKRILCFLIGYMEGNDQFRDAFIREVEYYLLQRGKVRA